VIGLDGRKVPNGCDWFPDQFWVWDWKACCDAHDIAYTLGGSDMDRWAVEWSFASCLFAVSPVLAVVMVPFTFLLGYAYFVRRMKR